MRPVERAGARLFRCGRNGNGEDYRRRRWWKSFPAWVRLPHQQPKKANRWRRETDHHSAGNEVKAAK
ncbi:MAG: hypothetical protein IJT94_05915 [Oscillibacter sp.]|nr:hypothetical protein [Oscillibacter sp.]